MKDPLSTCTYNLLYQNLKEFSKNGEHFCKELITLFQQRSELEINYAKGLQKLAGKLIKVCKMMSCNTTYNAWSLISNEMFSTADAHRMLGQALQKETTTDIRQILDEHTKRKRPLENAIERSGKLFATNWNEQLKQKKKLNGLTREHEVLFNYVEKNKHISTEKEKQKMLNRLTKSAELQVKADEDYFNMNIEGHEFRLKWENTLKACYQIVQELEKQRIETLFKSLNKYSLHMSSYNQTLLHSQKQVEQAIKKVDVEEDLKMLVEDTCVTANDTKAEFLMADYFEEDDKTVMTKERRGDALKPKLQRLEESITKTKKEKEGLEKMVVVYSGSTSNSSGKHLEETEQQLDETTLKLDLLEATHCKLNQTLRDLEGKPKTLHRFSDSITKFKDKDCEHSIVKLSRPVKIKKTPFKSRQSLRTSIMYKGPSKTRASHHEPAPSTKTKADLAEFTQHTKPQENTETNGVLPKSEDEGAELCSLGKCKALYDFSSETEEDFNIKEGDLLDILEKNESGWWYGELNGKRGHFPSNYVEELPVLNEAQSSDA